MKTMSKGELFVVAGPSGTGKGTILKSVFASVSNLYYSISATTRECRPGEVDGVHYNFYDIKQFEKLIDGDLLLEHAKYVDNYYGTPIAPVEEKLNSGQDVILEIDLQGARKVKQRKPDTVMIFVAPPSMEVLEQRLHGRATEDIAIIKKRLEAAKVECSGMEEFDYIVINNELGMAIDEVCSIITAHRCTRNRRNDFISNFK